MAKNTAIILVGHNHKQYLQRAIESLESQTAAPRAVYYIDNNSADGSAEYVETQFPHVHVIKNRHNVGYGSANNASISRLFADGYEYCLIMNPDVHLDKNALVQLIKTHKNHQFCGLVQPVILDATGKHINTVGNASHYLGFGYCPDTGKQYRSLREDTSIVSVSGACMLVHRQFFESVGGFDEMFFLYNEDQDLSWRGLLSGYVHYVSAGATAYHDYDFSRHGAKWYHSQKNRILMLLKNYSVTTLILLFFPFVVTELCYLAYGMWKGTFFATLRAYAFVATHTGGILASRAVIQRRRTVDDRTVLRRFAATLHSPLFRNPVIIYILNPFLALWYMVVSTL